MKLGAERQKVIILISLLVVAALVFVFNQEDSGPPAEATGTVARPTPAAGAAVPGIPSSPVAAARPTRTARRESKEFRPTVGARRGEERPDPMSIDPTLRLDILTKLQGVTVEGPRRSIFDFGTAPPPKPDPVKLAAAKPKVPSPLIGPAAPPPPAEEVKPPPPPPPPPIPLKFYGYASPLNNTKRAFFMEGDEIFIAAEGDLVKRRYKVVRIGVNSVVMEDTQHKHQQTLPLEEQPAG